MWEGHLWEAQQSCQRVGFADTPHSFNLNMCATDSTSDSISHAKFELLYSSMRLERLWTPLTYCKTWSMLFRVKCFAVISNTSKSKRNAIQYSQIRNAANEKVDIEKEVSHAIYLKLSTIFLIWWPCLGSVPTNNNIPLLRPSVMAAGEESVRFPLLMR